MEAALSKCSLPTACQRDEKIFHEVHLITAASHHIPTGRHRLHEEHVSAEILDVMTRRDDLRKGYPTSPGTIKWLPLYHHKVNHTDAVNKNVNDQRKNIVLDDLPHPINDSEKDLTRKERATLGYCRLLGSYKSRIKKDASLNVCANYGRTPHDVKHLFACPANATILIP